MESENAAEGMVIESELTYDQDMWGAIEGGEAEEMDREAGAFISRVLHAVEERQARQRSDEQQGYADKEEDEDESGDERTGHVEEKFWSERMGILTVDQQEAVHMYREVYDEYPNAGNEDDEEGGDDEQYEAIRHVHRVFKMRQTRGPNNPTVEMLEKYPQLAKVWQ